MAHGYDLLGLKVNGRVSSSTGSRIWFGSLLNQQARALNTANVQHSFTGISLEYLQQCLKNLSELNSKLKEIGREIMELNTGIRSEDDWENI